MEFWVPVGGLGGIFGDPRADNMEDVGLLQLWVFGGP